MTISKTSCGQLGGTRPLTSSACFLPSYNTRSTLTFSRFPVSVLILPRWFCRSAHAPRARTREGVGLQLAAVSKPREDVTDADADAEAEAGRARRQRERVSNTIMAE